MIFDFFENSFSTFLDFGKGLALYKGKDKVHKSLSPMNEKEKFYDCITWLPVGNNCDHSCCC